MIKTVTGSQSAHDLSSGKTSSAMAAEVAGACTFARVLGFHDWAISECGHGDHLKEFADAMTKNTMMMGACSRDII